MRMFKGHEAAPFNLLFLVVFGFLLPLFNAADAHAQYEAERKLPCNAYCRKWMGWGEPASTGKVELNAGGSAYRAARPLQAPPVTKRSADRQKLRQGGPAVSAAKLAGRGPEAKQAAARHGRPKRLSIQASRGSKIGLNNKLQVEHSSINDAVALRPQDTKPSLPLSKHGDRASATNPPRAGGSRMTPPPQASPVQMPVKVQNGSNTQMSGEQDLQQSTQADFRAEATPNSLNDVGARQHSNVRPEEKGVDAPSKFTDANVDYQHNRRFQSAEPSVPSPAVSTNAKTAPRSASPNRHFMSTDDRNILSMLIPFRDNAFHQTTDMKPGDVVGDQIKLRPLPAGVVAIAPYLSDLTFFVAGQDAFLVNPGSRRILKAYYGPDLDRMTDARFDLE